VIQVRAGNYLTVELLGSQYRLQIQADTAFAMGTTVVIAIRPEKILILADGASVPSTDGTLLEAEVMEQSYLGARYQYQLSLGAVILRVETPIVLQTKTVQAWIPAAGCAVFAAEELPPTITQSV
jgi:iron(III) transport system ATP-binding protein